MPYVNDSMSMVILLPASKDGLGKVIASPELRSAIYNLNNQFDYTAMDVSIQKFKLETDYSLIETLTQMGIRKVFTSEADLSGINGQRNLIVSEIKHKAVVKVDEAGTEAAAVTFVAVMPTSAMVPMTPPIEFKADRPFMFLIRNKGTGLVYFIGKVEEL
jgi:serpin B